MDDAARLVRRARRQRRVWFLTGVILLPILIVVSYVGSLGVICWGQSSGIVSPATTNQIPSLYYAPLSMYFARGGPGSMHVMQFLHWCSWTGDHDKPWQAYWEQVKADLEEEKAELDERMNSANRRL